MIINNRTMLALAEDLNKKSYEISNPDMSTIPTTSYTPGMRLVARSTETPGTCATNLNASKP